MPHELPGWVIYVVIGLAVMCFAFLTAWINEYRAFKTLDALSDEIEEQAFASSMRVIYLENENEQLKKQLADDASGQVRRNKKGQFESMKEKEA